MRKRGVMLGMLLVSCFVIAQQPELPGMFDVVRESQIDVVEWSVLTNPDSSLRTTPASDIVEALQAGVVANIWADDGELELIRTYREDIAFMLSQFRIAHYDAEYLNDQDVPIRFFQIEGQIGMLISDVAVPIVFNTFNQSERERGTRALVEYALPEALDLYEFVSGMDLRYAGLSIAYGTQDFTKDYLPPSGEVLVIIFPMEELARFSQGLLTDSDLADASFIFLGGLGTDIRRVSLDF